MSTRPTLRLPRAVSALLLSAASLAAPLGAQLIPAERIDEVARPALEREWLVGAVIGQHGPEGTLVHGLGTLTRGGERAPDGDTIFEIGSVSKVFTALLLADAVVRGELRLDTTVQELLPDDVQLGVNGRPITLLDLTTHTSGLPRMPSNLIPLDLARPYAGYGPERMLAFLDGHEPGRAPEAEWEYSNLAVGLLGWLLAEHAGTDYPTLLRERVLDPLGMHDSGVLADEVWGARLAPPHDMDAEPVATWELGAMQAAGGVRSSVHDMLRFARFCLGELQPEGSDTLIDALDLSLLPRRPMGGDGRMRMGLGWLINIDAGVWWHNGGTGGYHAMFEVLPDEGRAVVGLSNTANGVIEQLCDRMIVSWLGEGEYAITLPDQVIPERAELEPVVGNYYNAGAGVMVVELEGARLYGRLGIQPRFRLWPETTRRFSYRAVQAQVGFNEGEPSPGMTLFQNGLEIAFERIPEEPGEEE